MPTQAIVKDQVVLKFGDNLDDEADNDQTLELFAVNEDVTIDDKTTHVVYDADEDTIIFAGIEEDCDDKAENENHKTVTNGGEACYVVIPLEGKADTLKSFSFRMLELLQDNVARALHEKCLHLHNKLTDTEKAETKDKPYRLCKAVLLALDFPKVLEDAIGSEGLKPDVRRLKRINKSRMT